MNNRNFQGDVQYVLHRVVLSHHISWRHATTYRNICALHVDHVIQKNGQAVVVFDGYDDAQSTMDVINLR